MEHNVTIVIITSLAAIIASIGGIVIALNKNKTDFKHQQSASMSAMQIALNNQASQITEQLKCMLEEERRANRALREEVASLRQEIRELKSKLNN